MQKLFKTLLGISCVLLLSLTIVGCETSLDDVNKRIDDLAERVTELEKKVDAANKNISSITEFIDAIKANLMVSKVEKEGDNYVLTLSNNEKIVLRGGESPMLAVEKDEQSGNYYWKLDGNYILDGSGNPISVNPPEAIIPVIELGANLTGKDVDGEDFEATAWYLSVDDRTTWVRMNGQNADAIVTGIEIVGYEITITFSDGSTISAPYAKDFSFSVETEDLVNFTYGQAINFPIEQNNVKDSHVIAKPEGWKAYVADGTLSITAPAQAATSFESEGQVVVMAISTDGFSAMVKVNVRVYDGGTDNATDLSENGIANTYVVTEAGEYKFFARRPDPNSTREKEYGNNATWVWKSADGLIDEASISYDAGNQYIYFNVDNFSKGNVSIALRNSTGMILWSWHIWLNDDLNLETAASGQFLNHQMGGISNEISNTTGEVVGFYYQWGRKDPFPSVRDNTDGAEDVSTAFVGNTMPLIINTTDFPTYKWGKVDNVTWDVDMMVNTPTTILGHKQGLPSYPETEWNDVQNPCPYGWHVAEYDQIQQISAASESVWDDTYKGHKYEGLWFPKTGYRDPAAGRVFSLDYPYLWTYEGVANADISIPYLFEYKFTMSQPMGKSIAMGVRCSKK